MDTLELRLLDDGLTLSPWKIFGHPTAQNEEPGEIANCAVEPEASDSAADACNVVGLSVTAVWMKSEVQRCNNGLSRHPL